MKRVETVLTIGITPAPNDVYLFAGLLTGATSAGEEVRVSFVFGDEETLNARAQTGALDVARIGAACWGKMRGLYDLLPCGAAVGRGVGPLLLANRGGREAATFAPDRETLTPGASTTARFLLDWWYARGPVAARHLPSGDLYRELCNQPGAQGVVMGEGRFTYQCDGLTLLADLGESWEARTGRSAIPLGLLAVRKTRGGAGLAGTITAAIVRSLEWADQNPDAAFALCRRYAPGAGGDEASLRAFVGLYVNDLAYDLGDEGNAALAFFLDEQRRFGGGVDAERKG